MAEKIIELSKNRGGGGGNKLPSGNKTTIYNAGTVGASSATYNYTPTEDGYIQLEANVGSGNGFLWIEDKTTKLQMIAMQTPTSAYMAVNLPVAKGDSVDVTFQYVTNGMAYFIT